MLGVDFDRTLKLSTTLRAILRRREKLTVSQWADRHRWLPAEGNAIPGQWRTSTAPYMREVMDAIGDPATCSKMIFMKSARVGGTEAINNAIGYTIGNDPRPVMYVQGEQEAVAEEFRLKIAPMIESSPQLSTLIPRSPNGRPVQNWATSKRIRTGSAIIYGAWASNPSTLIRRTIALLLIDEVDNVALQDTRLGNFFDVASERVATFDDVARSTVAATGTPTNQHAAGWRALEASDFRTYHVPCPACGCYQRLVLGSVEVHPRSEEILAGTYPTLKLKDFDRTPRRALTREQRPTPEEIEGFQLGVLRCKSCEALLRWHDHHKWMIDRGVWVPRGFRVSQPHPLSRVGSKADREFLTVQPPGKQQKQPRLELDPAYDGPPPRLGPGGQPLPPNRHMIRGYQISQLYSFLKSRTWSHVLGQHFRVEHDPEKRRVFTNSWLGEPFREAVAELATTFLDAKRRSAHASIRGEVPPWAKLILVSADVQMDHCWYVARAYGVAGRSVLLSCGRVDPAGDMSDLGQLHHLAFAKGFRMPSLRLPGGPEPVLGAAALIIDRRYRTMAVDELAVNDGVCTAMGDGSSRGQSVAVRRLKGLYTHDKETKQFTFDSSALKTQLHHRIRLPEDDPGAFHLARETPEEYLYHLTNEVQQRVVVKTGKRRGQVDVVWAKKNDGVRVDLLDCEYYNLGLATALRYVGIASKIREQDQPVHWIVPPYAVDVARKPTKPKDPPRSPQSGVRGRFK